MSTRPKTRECVSCGQKAQRKYGNAFCSVEHAVSFAIDRADMMDYCERHGFWFDSPLDSCAMCEEEEEDD